MSQLESQIVRKILQELRKNEVWAVKIHGGPYQAAGLPDIVAISPGNGRFIGVEVKRPGGKATELQKATLRKIEAAGGVSGIAYSVEDVLALVEKAKGGKDT